MAYLTLSLKQAEYLKGIVHLLSVSLQKLSHYIYSGGVHGQNHTERSSERPPEKPDIIELLRLKY